MFVIVGNRVLIAILMLLSLPLWGNYIVMAIITVEKLCFQRKSVLNLWHDTVI